MSGILVYSEDRTVVRELLSKARQKTNGPVAAVLFGQVVDGLELGNWGADMVYTVQSPLLKEFNPETYTDALAGVIKQVGPDLVMVGATKPGLEVAGRAAERLGLGCASWCIDFDIDPQSGLVTAQCLIYSGMGLNTYKLRTRPAMVTVAPGVFEPVEAAGGPATVTPVEVEIKAPRLTVVEFNEKTETSRRLQDAPVIVDVGQGFKERADLAMAEELARLLGGQVACTRPISSERDWFPEWLGLSGAQLSPDLCFAVGISGAIQHVIGIRDSKIIVAVNNDENAGIHLQADYTVVADLYEFLPALIYTLKSRSISLV